jgi:DNA-binding NarL/FixJ family response regulator
MEEDRLLQQVSESPHLEPCLIVVIASEVRLLREALAETLGRDRAFTIAGLSVDLSQTLNIIRDRQPDVVLLDAAFSNGLDVVRQIRNFASDIRVIVFAVAETEESIVAWAEAGVSGYIPRTAALVDLVALLAEVLRGEQSCSGRVASSLLRRISEGTHPGNARTNVPRTPALTDREQQIIQLIGAGLSNKDIARRLDIGVPTTKSHVHNLLRKLDLQRRGQVAPWMREHEIDLHAAPMAQEQDMNGTRKKHNEGFRAKVPLTAIGALVDLLANSDWEMQLLACANAML